MEHNGVTLKTMTHNGVKVKKWTHNGVDVFKSEKEIYPDLWNGYLQSASANQNDIYENNLSEVIDCSEFTTLVWNGLFSNTSGYGTGTITVGVGSYQNGVDYYNKTFTRSIDTYSEPFSLELDVSNYDYVYLTLRSHVKSASSGVITVTFESSEILLK